MSPPHAATKHELLVRCLDAWAPAAFHRRATYVQTWAGSHTATVAALRVFGEFSDLLERHPLTVLLIDAPELEYVAPRGVIVTTVPGPLGQAVARTKGPMFGWFDSYDPVPPPDLAALRGADVLLALPDGAKSTPYLDTLRAGGLDFACQVELVDKTGAAELMIFASATEKALEKFKDELWALDEYAGIQLRDPTDPDGTLLDISVTPQLGPLRRMLLGRLKEAGEATVGELREWALRHTVFRSSDTTKALQVLVTAGAVRRDPPTGRLSPDTLITPGTPA